MSEELDTDAVREHHYGFKKRGGTFVNCMGCTRNYGGYHEYPCETVLLANEVDRLRAELSAARAAGGVQPAPTAETWCRCSPFAPSDPTRCVCEPSAGGATDQPPAEVGGTQPHVWRHTDRSDLTGSGMCQCGLPYGDVVHISKYAISAAGFTDGAGTPGEVCKIWHDLYGACELPYRHAGPHARIPGGATEANRWWGTTCECHACRFERAKLAEVTAGAHEYHASNASTICDECDLSAGDPIHRSAGTPDWDMAPGRWALIRNGEVVATAGPGSQGLSPDWVPVEQVTRNWSHEPDARELGLCEPTQLGPEDYPEDHACPYGCECPAPDPSCGLCHPHSATSRCAGA